MERPAMSFSCRGAVFAVVFLFLLLVRFPANAQESNPASIPQGLPANIPQGISASLQQRAVPPFIRDLAAVGVSINQGQPPATVNAIPISSDASTAW